MVIYSAQKNTLNSTKRGAGFNAQPGSCFSAPPAARADTGEHFTAEQPNPLLLAWSGARPISPVESGTAQHKGLMLPFVLGCKRCCQSFSPCVPLLEQMEPGVACCRQRKQQNFRWTPPGTRHTEMSCPTCLSQCSSRWLTSLSLALLPAQAFVPCQNLARGLEREITTPFLKVNYCSFNPR